MLNRDTYKAGISALLEARQSQALIEGTNLQTFRYEIAEGTDTSPEAVKNWICAVNGPSGPELLRLCDYFGPTFSREVWALIGQDGDALPVAALKDEARPHIEALTKIIAGERNAVPENNEALTA